MINHIEAEDRPLLTMMTFVVLSETLRTDGRFAMILSANIHFPPRMDYNPLSLPLVPSSCQIISDHPMILYHNDHVTFNLMAFPAASASSAFLSIDSFKEL